MRRHILDIYIRTFWMEPRQLEWRIELLVSYAPDNMKAAVENLKLGAQQNICIRWGLAVVFGWVSPDKPLFVLT
jgi:hypothetical protein